MPANSNPPPAPECEKMRAVQGQSQVVGAFLDWLSSVKRVHLMVDFESDETDMNGPVQVPIRESIEELLAEYFEIDLKKVEKEKQALLEYIRQQNSLQDQEG
jgi:hypothetical protein